MVTGLCYNYDPNFGSLSLFWRCKEHLCPLSPYLGLQRMLEISDLGWASWSWFGYGHWSLIYPWYKFGLSILILKVQRTSMSFKSWFGALEDAGGSWLGFGILILIWLWSLVFGSPMSQNCLFSLIFEVKRSSMSFKSWLGALEDAGGSWLGFGVLISIWIWSLVFDTPLV